MFLLFPSTPPIEMVGVGWVPSSISSSGVPGILLSTCVYFLCSLLHCSTKWSKHRVSTLQAWLLFLYTSFALRENVLLVNGSDIRPW
jgi:hypothetical protein